MPMLAELLDAVIGVDTHRDTHHVEIAYPTGTPIATCSVSNDSTGYAQLLGWIAQHAPGLRLVASIEGTRSYGAGLTRAITAAGLLVIECEQPSRKTRRGKGKSDPIDAHLAVLSALRLDADRLPTPRADGDREALRILLCAREELTTTSTAQTNRLRALPRMKTAFRLRLTGSCVQQNRAVAILQPTAAYAVNGLADGLDKALALRRWQQQMVGVGLYQAAVAFGVVAGRPVIAAGRPRREAHRWLNLVLSLRLLAKSGTAVERGGMFGVGGVDRVPHRAGELARPVPPHAQRTVLAQRTGGDGRAALRVEPMPRLRGDHEIERASLDGAVLECRLLHLDRHAPGALSRDGGHRRVRLHRHDRCPPPTECQCRAPGSGASLKHTFTGTKLQDVGVQLARVAGAPPVVELSDLSEALRTLRPLGVHVAARYPHAVSTAARAAT